MIATDCIDSCKSNYHTIMTMTAPRNLFLFKISMKYLSRKQLINLLWVSNKWLLFNTEQAIFHLQCILWQDQVTFQWDEDDSLFVPDKTLSWIFKVLNMSLYSDTLSWFWGNQSMLLLLEAVCIAQKQQIPILPSLWFDPTRARTHNLRHTRRAC